MHNISKRLLLLIKDTKNPRGLAKMISAMKSYIDWYSVQNTSFGDQILDALTKCNQPDWFYLITRSLWCIGQINPKEIKGLVKLVTDIINYEGDKESLRSNLHSLISKIPTFGNSFTIESKQIILDTFNKM